MASNPNEVFKYKYLKVSFLIRSMSLFLNLMVRSGEDIKIVRKDKKTATLEKIVPAPKKAASPKKKKDKKDYQWMDLKGEKREKALLVSAARVP